MEIFFIDSKDNLARQKKYDIEPVLHDNYAEKKLGKGFSKGKTMRRIGVIPVDFILGLPKEEQERLRHDSSYYKILLKKYPQWRCSEGGI